MNCRAWNLMFMILVGLAVVGCQTNARVSNEADHPAPTSSAYVDLQETEIRGLSAEDVEGYRTGSGMGLALPAELNGYPGPRHVLDLVEELELSEAQEAEIKTLFDNMQAEAIHLGEQILDHEEELELAFRDETIDEEELEDLLTRLGDLHTQLRFVHLRTHLATIDILTEEQVMHYNVIRGYESMPEDHDPDNMNHGEG